MKRKILASALLASAFIAPTAVVADDIGKAIEARQGYYKLVSANAGPLFGMAKGEVPYDATKAQTFANNLLSLSYMDNAALWPPGSDKASRPGDTRALPVAWETWPAIAEKHEAWKQAVAALAGSASGGLDALRGAIGPLGASCSGCHDVYRAKDF